MRKIRRRYRPLSIFDLKDALNREEFKHGFEVEIHHSDTSDKEADSFDAHEASIPPVSKKPGAE